MDQERKIQITSALNAWLERSEDNTQAKLAKLLNLNPAYISQIKRGLYKIGESDISAEIMARVAREIGHKMEEITLHWETENLQRIMQVCKTAQSMKRRMLLEGESGLGKTYGLEYYAQQNDKVVYVKATSSMTPNDLLGEILLKLGVRQMPHGTRNRLVKIREMAAKPGYLIILDEMEDVSTRIYKACKEIADFCQNTCGIVVSGIGLSDYFMKKGKQARRTPFVQLRRRFRGNTVVLRGVQKKEVERIVKQAGFAEKSAIAWWRNQIEDFDMLSQYLTDILSTTRKKNARLEVVTASELEAFFSI